MNSIQKIVKLRFLTGTVVDTVVTRSNYKESFLILQNVSQGTVSPTNFIVAEASENLKYRLDTMHCLQVDTYVLKLTWHSP